MKPATQAILQYGMHLESADGLRDVKIGRVVQLKIVESRNEEKTIEARNLDDAWEQAKDQFGLDCAEDDGVMKVTVDNVYLL